MAKCTKAGKIIHATQERAEAAIRSLAKAGRGNPHYNAYRCPHDPSHWHIGHSRNSLEKAMKNARRSAQVATAKARRRRKR